MEGAERRGFLLAMVENATKAHKAWAEGGDTHLLPEDNLFQRFEEISGQSRFINRVHASDLERLILEFGGHWRAFVSAQQQNMDVGMLPGENLWAAWEALDGERFTSTAPELKYIEPLAELVSQKVSPKQICLIYGFLRPDGSPDIRLMREEQEKPGRHTGADTGWVAPVNKAIVEKLKMAEIDREAIRRRRNMKVAAANTPAPETIEMLVADGVSCEQIAKMKKTSTDAVLQYCNDNNLPTPQMNYDATLKGPKPYDRDKSEERQRIEANMATQGPYTGPVGDGEAIEVNEGAEDLPIAEQMQITEAAGYAEQGMTPPQIAQHMRIKADAVRELLRKGGYEAAANAG